MSKYLITVKNLDGTDPKLDEMFADGLICNGFTIITSANDGDGNDAVAIYQMSKQDIACSMAASDELTRCAYLCKAMREAERATHGPFKDIIRRMVADDD